MLFIIFTSVAALQQLADAFSMTTVSSVRNNMKNNLPTIPSPELRKMQEHHRPIAKSFVVKEFNPHPALTNKHLQTIAGVFLRKNSDCAYITDTGFAGLSKVLSALSNIQSSEEVCTFWDERQRLTTSCGTDFYTVDVKYASERKQQFQSIESKGMIVLLHGLESNSNSSLSTDLGQAYVQDGFDVVCINFRGCCGLPNESLGGYHLGFTDDLLHFLQLIREQWETNDDFEKRPIYLSGFSLGANVVVKCLGELGDNAMTLYNVHGAAVVGAPFDAERNIKQVDAPGFNRAIYSRNFLKSLKKRAQYQLTTLCDDDPLTPLFDYKGVMAATTVAEFDDAAIAKIYGFKDRIDYYRSTSCYYYLPGVAVPLFIINAADDPFFDPDFFPFEESVDGGSLAPIKMERTEYGGHIGYMFALTDEKVKGDRQVSWMPSELTRFLSHVHSFREKK
jgi:predicted alpha/beta-fold hydrolase